MQQFLDALTQLVNTVNSYLSDYILVVLLVGVGIFFTIKTRFVQVRCFKQGIVNVFGKFSLNGKKHKGGMSSFQAFTTAVASQVGTGNIVGASSAILFGGPGAIFWMWIIAFLGMATIYSEAVLAQKTRKVNEDGSVLGGPVYYIRKAFSGKFGRFLAGFFAVAIIIALGFIGSMVQSNSITIAVNYAVDIPTWIIGLIISILAIFIFVGGTKRLASATEKIVPIMASFYIIGMIIVILFRITVLPQAIGMIFKFAFSPTAIIGGGIGYALKKTISMGAQRGLFSNEAGMGSTPHAHALANVKTPHEQGTVAMISVFIDTFIVLTLTALVIITSLYAGDGNIAKISSLALESNTSIIKALESAGYTANNLVSLAIAELFNNASVGRVIGASFVAICLFFFALSTIISWNLFGKLNFTYLFGNKKTIIYSVISVLFIFLGSLLQANLVWGFADLFNYLMVLPNAIALIMLSKVVVDELKQNCKKVQNQALNEKIKGEI
ncbi:MAG: sodium:alanine symporter family protein [Clostridiales bacterium]|nr:sodium:alanine symporter family protein [Clostridiales bacterium]